MMVMNSLICAGMLSRRSERRSYFSRACERRFKKVSMTAGF